MTSLTEVYEGGAGGANLRRLYLGVALFVGGAAFVMGGIVFATTDLGHSLFGLNWQGERELAGTLAGLGVPAVFLGILSVLPASRFVRAAAVVGTAVAAAGVLLFRAVYPHNWITAEVSHALPVVVVYFAGVVVTFWCLFAGVANFKTRNDPGGTVKLEITKEGETRVVEVEGDDLSSLGGLGGVGLLGNDPDGEVETQTAGRRDARSDGGTTARSSDSTDRGRPTTGRQTSSTPDSGPTAAGASDARDATDRYCGSCVHFRYVRTDDGLRPYCGAHDELMDDMDACPQWRSNA